MDGHRFFIQTDQNPRHRLPVFCPEADHIPGPKILHALPGALAL
jgi:hypothetical protein